METKQALHGYCSIVRNQNEPTEKQKELIDFMNSLKVDNGELTPENDFDNVEKLFEHANSLGLTEADILYCLLKAITSVALKKLMGL